MLFVVQNVLFLSDAFLDELVCKETWSRHPNQDLVCDTRWSRGESFSLPTESFWVETVKPKCLQCILKQETQPLLPHE